MTLPTVGSSYNTYGTELNAHINVSHDSDGKIKNGAEQTTSAAPTTDAMIANKKYVDTKEATLVTQATASIFGTKTDTDTISGAFAAESVYKAQCSGFIIIALLLNNDTDDMNINVGTNNPPTTQSWAYDNNSANMNTTIMLPVAKDEYWQVKLNGQLHTFTKATWQPIGTGGCVKQ